MTVRVYQMDTKEVQKLQDEVEKRLANGETFTLSEIRKIMRSTSLSYLQVVKKAKKLKKEIDRAEDEAMKNGKIFDRDLYIKQRMKQD